MNIHIILATVFIVFSLLGIFAPKKVSGKLENHLKIFNKNEETLISSRRTYGMVLLIESIIYLIFSIKISKDQIELSSIEHFLMIMFIVWFPLPIMFITYFFKYDKDGKRK